MGMENQEQLSVQEVIDSYKELVSHLQHELVIASCQIKARDRKIQSLTQGNE